MAWTSKKGNSEVNNFTTEKEELFAEESDSTTTAGPTVPQKSAQEVEDTVISIDRNILDMDIILIFGKSSDVHAKDEATINEDTYKAVVQVYSSIILHYFLFHRLYQIWGNIKKYCYKFVKVRKNFTWAMDKLTYTPDQFVG